MFWSSFPVAFSHPKQEKAKGEEYLDIQIYRFYIKCPVCSAEIAFKTDPKNTDYVVEMGATRTFDDNKMKDRIGTIDDEIAAEAKANEEVNAMKALEERTKESKAEMDMIDALEDIKDANARNSKVDVNSVIARKIDEGMVEIRALAAKIIADEEAAVKKHFGYEGPIIKRLDDSNTDSTAPTVSKSNADVFAKPGPMPKKAKHLAMSDKSVGSLGGGAKGLGLVIKKKDSLPSNTVTASATSHKATANTTNGTSLGLLGNYDSSSDDE